MCVLQEIGFEKKRVLVLRNNVFWFGEIHFLGFEKNISSFFLRKTFSRFDKYISSRPRKTFLGFEKVG